MARQENYKILIGTNIARTPALTVGTLANGEIACVKSDMTIMVPGETVSDSDYIYVVQGTGAAPRFSSKIQGAQVEKWEGTSFAAAVQQESYVGYDAVAAAGSINLVNSTEYVLTLVFYYDKVIGSERQLVRRFYYTSDSTATQAEIAAAFVALINADPVAATLVVAAVVAAGLNNGIHITGLAQTYAIIDGYEQVTWKVAMDGGFNDGGATTLAVNNVFPNYGSGTFPHVSDLERAAVGYSGITNLMQFPVPPYPVYAVVGTFYDVYSITYSDKHATGNLNKDGYSPEMTLVAIPNGGAGQQLAFENEINPWMNSTAGNFLALAL